MDSGVFLYVLRRFCWATFGFVTRVVERLRQNDLRNRLCAVSVQNADLSGDALLIEISHRFIGRDALRFDVVELFVCVELVCLGTHVVFTCAGMMTATFRHQFEEVFPL